MSLDHTHHWLVATPDGSAQVAAACKRCPATRTFWAAGEQERYSLLVYQVIGRGTAQSGTPTERLEAAEARQLRGSKKGAEMRHRKAATA